MVIGPELTKTHGNAKLEWAKDAQGKKVGQGCPRRKKWAKEAHKQENGSRKLKEA